MPNLCDARDAMPDGMRLKIEMANKSLDGRARGDTTLADQGIWRFLPAIACRKSLTITFLVTEIEDRVVGHVPRLPRGLISRDYIIHHGIVFFKTSLPKTVMSDRYTVDWSGSNRVLHLSMSGFWTHADGAPFSASLTQMARRAAGQPFDVIADLSRLDTQSQTVAALQGDMIAGMNAAGIKRLVIVGAGPLLTMQVRQAASTLAPHFVGTADEARNRLENRR